jgi:SSS family solute:Na+ symporter
VVVILGIVWIPVMKLVSGGGLYQYLQSVQGYLAPPITATFLLGLFFRRITARGAFVGLLSGFVLGMAKLGLQALDGAGALGDSGLLHAIGSYNFLYASGWLFAISAAVVVGVSLSSPPQPDAQIAGLTYGSLSPAQKAESRASWGVAEVAGTAAVLALVLGIYVYFSFWLG